MNNQDLHTNQVATLQNVLRWLLNHAKLSPNSLAKKLALPAPTINRLVTGEVTDPRASTLTTIADYFGVTPGQLLGRETLNGKYAEHEQVQPPIFRPPMSIPILTLAEAVEYERFFEASSNWFRWQKQSHDSEGETHKNIFAVNIKNNLYEPTFMKGAFIIVNPNINLNSGDYVLVNFSGDPAAVIKKYIAEGHYKYLYPLNPDLKTVMLEENACYIIGVIIEAYISFKNY